MGECTRSWRDWSDKLTDSEMKRDVDASRKIAPQAKDFTQWIKDSPKVQEHFGFKA